MLVRLSGTFRSKRKAIEALRNIAEVHQNYVQKRLGLESGKGRCFAHVAISVKVFVTAKAI